ncbi:hypothetical protein [Actinomadura sp. NBRC 104425]|uniref:DUF6891 domain-containing protein n=1 Tax=Actinomadura sp. NBRC 104425 TaxID=3032204 RepID=UPI00255709FA|nr:hypothetical protein [Actinomadura sp. NBRC 104425]
MIDERRQDDLRQYVRLLLALGEEDFDGIVQNGTEYLDDAPGAEAPARRLAEEEFAGYLADQRTWPEVLESDRLLRAFRDLDLAGIVARVDFTCCQSCGVCEIGDEVPDDEHHAYRGYVFCHRQDMHGAVHGDGLYLSYGVFTDAPVQVPGGSAAIGEEVAAALRRHGLQVDWGGDPGKRIGVPLTWRRRRFGRFAVWPGGPAPAAAPGPGGLSVSYCDHRRGHHEDRPVPVSLAEARTVLHALTPWENNFAVFEGRSGEVVQMRWKKGRRLWLESPDPAARCSRGRHVTPDEADDLVTALAREDRVALDRLGEVETVPWG